MSFKEKIAICLPSYNESKNIKNITKKLDLYLQKYVKKYDIYIVNCDNNSLDHTNELFNSVKTFCTKESILSLKKGKGYNLLNFFDYVKDNDIDYAITIDSDVLSLEEEWIDLFLYNLIEKKYDYVVPIYERSRFEGSTTNHFAFPLVYITTGYSIRQPIAGDFAFNKKFINLIIDQPYNNAVTQYGIDIYMTLIACLNNLKIKQVKLDKKMHSPSYSKMENMFIDVLEASIFTLKNNHDKINDCSNISDIVFDKSLCSISKSRKFNHKMTALELNKKYHVDGINVEDVWPIEMAKLILKLDIFDLNFYKGLFVDRVTSFWLNSEKISSFDCEKKIIEQATRIKNIYFQGGN